MKILSLLVCTFVVFETAVNAWTESKKCDGHDGDTVNRRRRRAMEGHGASARASQVKTNTLNTSRDKNLRGYDHRKLGSEPTIETFKLKMHWEEDYCWQLEDFDRNWCMSCVGGRCTEGDLLWVQACNDALIQRFVWEPVTIPGRNATGKLKPYLNQDICLEYVGTNGTYSHFGVTNPRWWYFLLLECEDGNDLQILEGFDDNDPFELLSWDETLTDVRCLTQAHDPRAGEIILGEELSVSRFDFTSLWDKHEVDYLPETPEQDSSRFCPPWPLMITDFPDWEIVTSGNTLVNWQADTFVEQYDNGRFVVRRGFPDRKEAILFDNKLDLSTDDYFTQLRGNGDLITFRGTPDNPKGDSVWKIENDSPEGQYFLGVECDLGTVSIYEYVPEDPGKQLWSTNGTDWVPDGSTMPLISSIVPTESPSLAPTAGPTSPVATTNEPEATTAVPETTFTEPDTTTAMPETTTAEPEATTQATPSPTSLPTSSPTPVGNIAPGIVAVDGSFCTPTAPCQICYGDCDEDTDCEGDLICEQREPGQAVSGCSGGEQSTSPTDYCVDPNAVGVGGSPTTSPLSDETPGGSLPVLSYSNTCSPTSPCEKCVGDCDVDSDCLGILVCKDRTGGEPVPGCSGSTSSKTDFCVDP